MTCYASAIADLVGWVDIHETQHNTKIIDISTEAQPTLKTKYGQKYQIIGTLICPNGRSLKIKTIWIVTEQNTKFVTLFPA